VEGDVIRELTHRSPALADRFLQRMAADLEISNDLLLASRALSLRARVAHILFVLKDRFDRVDSEGNIVLTLPLSRRDLARLVGVRPESLSRGIRQLEQAGVAHFEGKQVVIPDLDALLDTIEGNGSEKTQ
jgi:CRP/FNR family transcriptional regulator